jgi:hypothetical protein
VHGDIDTAIQQSLIDLLCEETLSTDVRERLVQNLVARGLDDLDLERALLIQLRKVALLVVEDGQVRHTHTHIWMVQCKNIEEEKH